MQHFNNCCCKELWDSILFLFVNNGQVYPMLKEIKVELKHLSFAFRECDQLLSWLPFRYFPGSFSQAVLGGGKSFLFAKEGSWFSQMTCFFYQGQGKAFRRWHDVIFWLFDHSPDLKKTLVYCKIKRDLPCGNRVSQDWVNFFGKGSSVTDLFFYMLKCRGTALICWWFNLRFGYHGKQTTQLQLTVWFKLHLANISSTCVMANSVW